MVLLVAPEVALGVEALLERVMEGLPHRLVVSV